MPAGTKMFIGKPKVPLDPGLTKQIAHAAYAAPGVVEAYLPQIFVQGVMREPAQALCLVLDAHTSRHTVYEALSRLLPIVIPSGLHLDVRFLAHDDSMLATIRSLGCALSRPNGFKRLLSFFRPRGT